MWGAKQSPLFNKHGLDKFNFTVYKIYNGNHDCCCNRIGTCLVGTTNQEKQNCNRMDSHIQLAVWMDWDWLAGCIIYGCKKITPWTTWGIFL